jgi:hypothetical protein
MTGYRSARWSATPSCIAAQRTLRPNIGTASPDFVQRAALAAWSDDEHARSERRGIFDAKRSGAPGVPGGRGLHRQRQRGDVLPVGRRPWRRRRGLRRGAAARTGDRVSPDGRSAPQAPAGCAWRSSRCGRLPEAVARGARRSPPARPGHDCPDTSQDTRSIGDRHLTPGNDRRRVRRRHAHDRRGAERRGRGARPARQRRGPHRREGRGEWVVHEWLKRAILLSFRQRDMATDRGRPVRVPRQGAAQARLRRGGRPGRAPAVVRHGAFVERGAVLMPSYVNIGAWVGSGTMVDTWATVGSCAQIGRNVHLAGGVGIGGVLEPPVRDRSSSRTTRSSARAASSPRASWSRRGRARRRRRAHRVGADHRRHRLGAGHAQGSRPARSVVIPGPGPRTSRQAPSTSLRADHRQRSARRPTRRRA